MPSHFHSHTPSPGFTERTRIHTQRVLIALVSRTEAYSHRFFFSAHFEVLSRWFLGHFFCGGRILVLKIPSHFHNLSPSPSSSPAARPSSACTPSTRGWPPARGWPWRMRRRAPRRSSTPRPRPPTGLTPPQPIPQPGIPGIMMYFLSLPNDPISVL